MSKQLDQVEALIRHAVEADDAVLRNMVYAQMYHPREWGEFLVDVILTLSTVNKDLREQLVRAISNQPPPPIYVHTGGFVPDGAWSSDYPTDFTPDGAWPTES